MITCSACGGSGLIKKKRPCPYCKGRGMIFVKSNIEAQTLGDVAVIKRKEK